MERATWQIALTRWASPPPPSHSSSDVKTLPAIRSSASRRAARDLNYIPNAACCGVKVPPHRPPHGRAPDDPSFPSSTRCHHRHVINIQRRGYPASSSSLRDRRLTPR